MNEAHLFAIGILLAWLAGIRVYLTVFGVGIVVAISVSIALLVWWLWRKLFRRAPRPS